MYTYIFIISCRSTSSNIILSVINLFYIIVILIVNFSWKIRWFILFPVYKVETEDNQRNDAHDIKPQNLYPNPKEGNLVVKGFLNVSLHVALVKLCEQNYLCINEYCEAKAGVQVEESAKSFDHLLIFQLNYFNYVLNAVEEVVDYEREEYIVDFRFALCHTFVTLICTEIIARLQLQVVRWARKGCVKVCNYCYIHYAKDQRKEKGHISYWEEAFLIGDTHLKHLVWEVNFSGV